jgi:hypothetical protein
MVTLTYTQVTSTAQALKNYTDGPVTLMTTEKKCHLTL